MNKWPLLILCVHGSFGAYAMAYLPSLLLVKFLQYVDLELIMDAGWEAAMS